MPNDVVFRHNRVTYFKSSKIKYPVFIRFKVKNKWTVDTIPYDNLGEAITMAKEFNHVTIAPRDGSVYYARHNKCILVAIPIV